MDETPKKAPVFGKSPVVSAIAWAEKLSTSEIRVHISKRWYDRDAFKRAQKLFVDFEMSKTRDRNAVLIYVNLRRRIFAVVGDTEVNKKLGHRYWDELVISLREDLLSTHPENAIAFAVRTLGVSLMTHFPRDATLSDPGSLQTV